MVLKLLLCWFSLRFQLAFTKLWPHADLYWCNPAVPSQIHNLLGGYNKQIDNNAQWGRDEKKPQASEVLERRGARLKEVILKAGGWWGSAPLIWQNSMGKDNESRGWITGPLEICGWGFTGQGFRWQVKVGRFWPELMRDSQTAAEQGPRMIKMGL